MKKMYDYINYIEPIKTKEVLEQEFIKDFISFRKENNLTQDLLAAYSKVNRVKIARIESEDKETIENISIKELKKLIGNNGNKNETTNLHK